LAGLYALFAAFGPVESAPALCPLWILTKQRCPFCGLTRATRALTKAELGRALALHPLAPLIWAVAIGGLAKLRSQSTVFTSPDVTPYLGKEIANGRKRSAG
jgi:hypothetical protein